MSSELSTAPVSSEPSVPKASSSEKKKASNKKKDVADKPNKHRLSPKDQFPNSVLNVPDASVNRFAKTFGVGQKSLDFKIGLKIVIGNAIAHILRSAVNYKKAVESLPTSNKSGSTSINANDIYRAVCTDGSLNSVFHDSVLYLKNERQKKNKLAKESKKRKNAVSKSKSAKKKSKSKNHKSEESDSKEKEEKAVMENESVSTKQSKGQGKSKPADVPEAESEDQEHEEKHQSDAEEDAPPKKKRRSKSGSSRK